MATFYQVIPLEANLRSQPRLDPKTILAQLKQGQQVEALPAITKLPAGWCRVRADLQGTSVEGYVKAFLLKKAVPVPVPAPLPVLPDLLEARLRSPDPVRRNQSGDGPRVFDLTEPHQPGRTGPTPADRARQLGDILTYLGVGHSARYAAGAGKTYCNIYAHDYAHLAGTFVPRVWWTRKALMALAAGQAMPPAYGTTVQELNANSLYNWLEEFGPDFGWHRSVDLTEVQHAANAGQVCLVSGQRKDLNTAGHICAVVPEMAEHRAIRQGERVRVPLMSQAGARNFAYGGRVWWTGAQFGRFGFWIHA